MRKATLAERERWSTQGRCCWLTVGRRAPWHTARNFSVDCMNVEVVYIPWTCYDVHSSGWGGEVKWSTVTGWTLTRPKEVVGSGIPPPCPTPSVVSGNCCILIFSCSSLPFAAAPLASFDSSRAPANASNVKRQKERRHRRACFKRQTRRHHEHRRECCRLSKLALEGAPPRRSQGPGSRPSPA